MHYYAVNSNERFFVSFWIAVISVFVTGAVQTFLVNANILPTFKILAPTAFVSYSLLYSVFDKFLWKWSLFKKLGIVKIPDLNGPWNSILSSSLDNFEKEFTSKVDIHQTWSKINIFFDGDDVFGESLMASFRIITPNRAVLSYEYLSKKKPEFADDEFMHHGFSHLMLEMDKFISINKMAGDYYTERSRNSYGKIRFEKL